LTHLLVSADYHLEIQPNIILNAYPFDSWVHIVSFATPETVMNHPTYMLNVIKMKQSFGLLQFGFKIIRGFSRKEINRIQKLVEEHQDRLLEGWNDFFND
jgi:hypothetical protein